MGLFPKDNIFCQTTGTYKIKKKKTYCDHLQNKS